MTDQMKELTQQMYDAVREADSDKALADALVERGVIFERLFSDGTFYWIAHINETYSADNIVRDPRVAMQCLKRWPDGGLLHWKIVQRIDSNDASKGLICQNERAIVEAFVRSFDE